jgi:hypothetical protein
MILDAESKILVVVLLTLLTALLMFDEVESIMEVAESMSPPRLKVVMMTMKL